MQPSNGSKDAPAAEKTCGAANGGPSSSSGNQQFCLRWNNYQSNLTNVFDQLLQNGTFVDVTIACDGHTLKAHKIVLSACSPYFQSMLAENKCKHPIVILKDVQWPELRAVVDFMYKGEINVYQEQIGPLLRVAETLKVRGLADVSNEQLTGGGGAGEPQAAATVVTPTSMAPESPKQPARKRHRLSPPAASPESVVSEMGASAADTPLNLHHMPPPPAPHHQQQQQQQQAQPSHVHQHQQQQQQQQQHQQQQQQQQSSQQTSSQQSMPPSASSASSSSSSSSSIPPPSSVADDMEIKPGIAEMIREEERAKMFESSQAWLASTSSPMTSDSYQYQLQSMWQKCWNTNQSLVHNLRFRERGPLKSWRPETMAEAILSVLKEGLSLSQAARKYDIPYPTFVLYANRVHNLLGPSADGGADLRPKGRGRPQRILLGFWPEDHIQNVIRTVVFRDAQNIKEEALHLYPRIPCLSDPMPGGHYGNNAVQSVEGPVSPNSAAAAVAAVAQGIRQQMMAAAGHNISPSSGVDAFALLASSHLPSPADMSPNSSPPDSPLVSNNNVEVSLSGYKRSIDHSNQDNVFVEDIDELVKNSHCTGGSSMGNTIDQQPLPLVIEQRTE